MTTTEQQNQKLSTREKICYGIGDVSNGLAVSSVSVWLLIYLTDVVGLSAFLAGFAVTIGRLWDAVTDPIMGWITDHTKSRWGKRRPYLLFGAIPYAISFVALWMAPDFSSEYSLFLYVTIALLAFNTFLTVVFVPYTSLTAAITTDYHERTSITGFRMVCSQSAFLLGATIPPLITAYTISENGQGLLNEWGIQPYFGDWAGTAKQGYAIMALLFGLIIIFSIWTTFFGTVERDLSSMSSSNSTSNPLTYASSIIGELRGNKPYLLAVLVLLASNCAGTLAAANLPYYLQYILEIPKAEQSGILGLIFITATISVPFWVYRAKHSSKSATYIKAMYIYIAALLLLPFLSRSTVYPIAIIIGFCHAAALTLPWAMIPDVVEFDELKVGQRREGLFYGGTTFTYKAATGLAFMISALILGLVGYQPNEAQTSGASLGIQMLISVGPALFLAIGAICASKYPLTPEVHQKIRDSIREKSQQ